MKMASCPSRRLIRIVLPRLETWNLVAAGVTAGAAAQTLALSAR
jgi:hypothetical protein